MKLSIQLSVLIASCKRLSDTSYKALDLLACLQHRQLNFVFVKNFLIQTDKLSVWMSLQAQCPTAWPDARGAYFGGMYEGLM